VRLVYPHGSASLYQGFVIVANFIHYIFLNVQGIFVVLRLVIVTPYLTRVVLRKGFIVEFTFNASFYTLKLPARKLLRFYLTINCFVAHDGEVGTTRKTQAAHNSGYLRNSDYLHFGGYF